MTQLLKLANEFEDKISLAQSVEERIAHLIQELKNAQDNVNYLTKLVHKRNARIKKLIEDIGYFNERETQLMNEIGIKDNEIFKLRREVAALKDHLKR